MPNQRTCHICGTVSDSWCPTCVAAFPHRRDAATMAPEERLAEFDQHRILEIPFDLLHRRIEELVGRPVWTHELASRNIERLRTEILSGEQPTMAQIVEKGPAEKRVVVEI